MIRTALILLILNQLAIAQELPPRDTQPETIKLTTPQQALASLVLPEGFRATLFASEPNVRQPIAMTTDSRGRLWFAENNTYADRTLNFDLSQRDRIHILEDADGDGVAEKFKTFWDQGKLLTSVEVGFGGVWALCPPQLLFIPDKNGDDVPDGEPVVILDGWDNGPVRHNIANGLRWGPDGWLYGRHGIQATSFVGAPGTVPAERVPVNCAIWRYHPIRKVFEVVCRGGTNSWGMDWDQLGELFYINTVIGHLWHALPGAHTQRMYGEDFNPYLYELIGQTADHFHWDTAEVWSKIRDGKPSATTDQAGGGHAHSGMIIYQGANWPEKYRGTLFTVNLHGRRLNNDTLERKGAGYVGKHAPDFLTTSDPWFRGIELVSGPDGGVYLADWTDIGECHENDGVHRSSGRIFKITYGSPQRPKIADVSRLENAELVALLTGKEEWFARAARHVLYERSSRGMPMETVHKELKGLFSLDADPVHQLRALWCLHVTRGTSPDWLLRQLSNPNEHVRAWVVRLLVDEHAPSPAVLRKFAELAAQDASGLVLSYLASALQKMPPGERWPLAEALAGRNEFADDPVFPLMVWYGIEASVPDAPARAVRLAESSRLPIVVQFISRRLTENIKQFAAPVNLLVTAAGQSGHAERTREILHGMATALRGWRQAPAPSAWKSTQSKLAASTDAEVEQLVRELSVVFGDGRALDDLLRVASSNSADIAVRRDAIRVLVEARASGAVPLLKRLFPDRDLGADAARGLAAFEDSATPVFLIENFNKVRDPARDAAIITLSSRPAWAKLLLEAIASNRIERARVPAFQIRQMVSFPDEDIRRRVNALWPELKSIAAAKRPRIEALQTKLTSAELSTADLPNGRRHFVKACANCHTLFGQGGKIGPDLTGAQRSNLTYLLENIVDPSATLSADYRMTTLALKDGRVLSGVIVGNKTGPTLTVQTPTERLVVNRDDVEESRPSELSLMPEGLLDVLSPKDARDLIGYLMSPQQVPLPEGQ